MRSFAEIHAIAASRKGGEDALEHLLDAPLTAGELAGLPASVWLEAMAKALFQAGFNWSVINAKWPAFRAAFHDFDVARLAFSSDEEIDRLLSDKTIVRNGAKIMAVIDNARFLQSLEEETGSASRHLANWPVEDQGGLLALFSSRGSRLGGATGQRVCRMVGRDSYVLSPDVCKRLIEERVIDAFPTSKKALEAVQQAFNRWRAESGRPFTQISQILAMSVES